MLNVKNNKGFVMRYFLYLGLLGLVACTKEPNVAVRIDCGDYNDKGLQATLNGQPVGDCPVDIMLHAGEVNVNVRKDNEDASYLFAEAKMTLAENAMKRIKLDVKPVFTERFHFLKVTDIQTAEEYLSKYPSGAYQKEVEIKLEGFYFSLADNPENWKIYLLKYPNGNRSEEIKIKLDSYERSMVTKRKNIDARLSELKKEVVSMLMFSGGLNSGVGRKYFFKNNSCELVDTNKTNNENISSEMRIPLQKIIFSYKSLSDSPKAYQVMFMCENSGNCIEDEFVGSGNPIELRPNTSRLMLGLTDLAQVKKFITNLEQLSQLCKG